MNSLYKIIGRNLRELRLSQGYTQKEVAECLGILYQNYQKYEYGTTRIPLDKLAEIAGLFGEDVLFFLVDNSTKENER